MEFSEEEYITEGIFKNLCQLAIPVKSEKLLIQGLLYNAGGVPLASEP